MSDRFIEHPAIPFVTSIGALAFQVISWFPLYSIGIANHLDGQSIAMTVAAAVWLFLPVISLIGFTSAIICIRKKNRIFLSSIGLALNIAYFALFVVFIFVSFTVGMSV